VRELRFEQAFALSGGVNGLGVTLKLAYRD